MKQGCRSIVFKYVDLLGYDTDCTVFVKALEVAACKRLELAISCLRSYFLTSIFIYVYGDKHDYHISATLCCRLPEVVHRSSNFTATTALAPSIVLIHVDEFC